MRILLWLILLGANAAVWASFLTLKAADRRLADAAAKDRDREKALLEQASRTYSTGLWMKHRFFEEAEAALEKRKTARQEGKTGPQEGVCALAAFDGDKFSALYRNYGPGMVGGLVGVIADCLKECFPENESTLLCNVSSRSDEFIMLLDRPSRERIMQELEDFCDRVRELEFHFGEMTVRGTVSIGVAFAEEGEADPKALYEAACRAQNAAKQAGGARVLEDKL